MTAQVRLALLAGTVLALSSTARADISAQAFDEPVANSYTRAAFQDFHDRDYRKGIAKLTAALASHPSAKDAATIHTARAWGYVKVSDYPQALADCEEALRLDPTAEYGEWNCASAAYGARRYAKVVAHCTQALARKPRKPWDYFAARGTAYEKLGEAALARRDYEQALPKPVKHAEDYANRAALLSKLGREESAAADLARAKEMQPRDPYYLNELAWCQATSPSAKVRDGKGAVQNATLACERSQWKDTNFLDTLAAACAEAGDFAHAIDYENKAIKLQKDPTSRAELQKHAALFAKGKPVREDLALLK